ncbi:preprotein translocase subunit SecA [Rhodospirillum rubrum]|uniref:preprotein translocase subunit SecA n=1 Tax=Rhodospirillum rubrum TaxID=1085 RepID=UPI001904CDF8|nr:preprotein translocase subunit SecA [Rhodospirillum rubrum]MBK1666006.1 preprotein translocase subunit SecA [Rhodospirillum rubrum]MBK1678137.1 preprotein translocase subunit SecA [Rhodospirillum rubrum]
MFGAIARRLFGSANDRIVKSLVKTVAAINAKESEVQGLSDADLAARTPWLKSRLAEGETLDDILVDAFATVREAAKRTLGQRHYDVQLMGGLVLHGGKIAEMRTGEGKTLVATLPVYLNALTGKGVHVVTVNDYLAKRDAEWMAKVYRFLGLTVGVIVHELDDGGRRAAYACDVTYGTNNELGFDFLRDNMKYRLEDMVQRPFAYAIVDEVDSILIDEARTPLIISGQAEDSSALYQAVDTLMPRLVPADYEKDEKARSVTYTEEGSDHIEELLREAGLLADGNLYETRNVTALHHATQGLRAHTLFERDVHYMVRDDKVVIIDEFTGRAMEGRRFSDGLHQALEAKEGVSIQPENQTLASITFQNYFRMYPKLSGMTGTALTEANEFMEIYGLAVVEIPTNRPMIRKDKDDEVYRTSREKYEAIAKQIAECQKRGQPVLVGTTSIEKSEYLAELMRTTTKVKPQVLNARYHEQEAFIIAQAGVPGAVTIATNMAGRGTDIQLGGNLDMRMARELPADATPEQRVAKEAELRADIEKKKAQALAAGGLYVIGTERHESRRIDNQLRGRTGRQGDPGGSSFYLSLDDDLMRIFGSERMDSMLRKLGLEEGEAIVHPWVNKALEKAQQKVEARNFDTRKNLLKFDDVMNDQRKVVYEQRRDLMVTTDVSETVADMRQEVIEDIVHAHIPPKAMPEEWDSAGLAEDVRRVFGLDLPIIDWAAEDGIANEEILERLTKDVEAKMAAKEAEYGADVMRMVEKSLLLQILDGMWKEHLLHLEHLRQGISLRAFGQRDPLNEYKSESFEMFQTMLSDLRERVTMTLANVQLRMDPPPPPPEPQGYAEHAEPEPAIGGGGVPGVAPAATDRDATHPETWGKVARNELCPCGSGKKYKHCHGAMG